MNDSIVPGVVYIHVGNEIQKLCETSDIHIDIGKCSSFL